MTLSVPLLETRHLTRRFSGRRRWWRSAPDVTAVDDVSLAIAEGELFGLVGESGSGKSTVARCSVGLIDPSEGEIRWRGEPIATWSAARRRHFRREAQLVFQDTATSLSPRLTIGASVREPLDVQRDGTSAERDERVAALLDMVGLDPAVANRRPDALSGGQRQRVVLARAMALAPALLVADEPVSSLDPCTQAQVMNLLLDLRATHRLTCLVVLHDLHLVRRVCDRVGVMCRGRLVEMGATAALFDAPAHRYTQRLLAARLSLEPDDADRTQQQTLVPPPGDDELRRPLVAVGPDHLAAVG